jgi:multiple sugar transport system substrate-binding protein
MHRAACSSACRAALALFALIVVGCQSAPPLGPTGRGDGARPLVFLSSQGRPVNQAEGIRRQVLASFRGAVLFDSRLRDDELVRRLAAEHSSGPSSTDLVAGLAGDFPTLARKGALADLGEQGQRVQDHLEPGLAAIWRRDPYSRYYIPWLQATYLLAVNRRALPYLPEGADVRRLTYDQLVQWGVNMLHATGERKIGLPVGPDGLIARMVEGYWYPSYTGAALTRFASSDAVSMWSTIRRLWAVTNPESTTYGLMQDSLLSGEVWVGWDHQASLLPTLQSSPDLIEVPSPSGPAGLGFLTVLVGLAIPADTPNRSSAAALIDFLTAADSQSRAATIVGFLPVVRVPGGSGLSPMVLAEEDAATRQRNAPRTVPAQLPVGLGPLDAQFNDLFRETFLRIAVQGQSIPSVLADVAGRLQRLLDAGETACWQPDPPSHGACRVG